MTLENIFLLLYHKTVCVCVCVRVGMRGVHKLSHVGLFATPWTVALQSPLPMGFSRQEYWSGLPSPSPGESSQPRNWTHISCISCISCIGRQILYHWATWEAYILYRKTKMRNSQLLPAFTASYNKKTDLGRRCVGSQLDIKDWTHSFTEHGP